MNSIIERDICVPVFSEELAIVPLPFSLPNELHGLNVVLKKQVEDGESSDDDTYITTQASSSIADDMK